MRVVVTGPALARARVRRVLEAAGIDVVAEADAEPEAHDGSEDLEVAVASDPAIEPLTPREQDVLALVAEGLSNKAIAEALGISDQTVKFHVAAIIAKLRAANRTDAVRRAVRRGLVTL